MPICRYINTHTHSHHRNWDTWCVAHGNNWESTLFSWLHVYYAHIASVILGDLSTLCVYRGSLMATIYIYIIYIYIYIYIYRYIYVYILYIYIFIIYIRTYIYVYVCIICIYIILYIYTCIHLYMYICIYIVYIYIYVGICQYIPVYIICWHNYHTNLYHMYYIYKGHVWKL